MTATDSVSHVLFLWLVLRATGMEEAVHCFWAVGSKGIIFNILDFITLYLLLSVSLFYTQYVPSLHAP